MRLIWILVLSFGVMVPKALAQTGTTNKIVTAVPFLSISPDARSGALGDAGVAISPDANSLYWNPSKLAFMEYPAMASLSYSPWLKNIVPNVFLFYGSYIHRLDERNTLGGSFRYFNLGNIDLYDDIRNATGIAHPYEFSLDGSLARKFGENFSMGLTLRYVYSALSTAGISHGQLNSGNSALAADVSLYVKTPVIQFGKEASLAFGTNISNIGGRINYSENGGKFFLPTNLKVGVANTLPLDDKSTLTLAVDLNKLLVPTPPIRDADQVIIKGKDDDKTVVEGMFGSFSDAPGGLKEELQELSISSGIEYSYNKQFAFRAGYFYEHPNKGNRRYFTVGAGFSHQALRIDFCYLKASQEKSPLANTIRLSIGYYLNSKF